MVNDYKEREMLIKTALGQTPADVVIKNGKIVNVYTGEILEEDVAIKGKRIALVGDAKHTIGKNTEIIDAKGYFLAPGLMDPHWHPESTMVTICEVAKAIVPQGITSLIVDAHEISAVLGVKGVELLIEDGKKSPIKTFVCPPIHVPQTPKIVTTGGKIGSRDIWRLLHSPDIEAVAEVAPNVVMDLQPYHKAGFLAAFDSRKAISGHSTGLSGKELNAFIAAGVQDCHDAVTVDEAHERLRLGMKVIAMEGTGGKYLDKIIGVVTERKMDPRHFMLCTDDIQPDEIVEKRHLDYVVRKAISNGVDPIVAIQMVTINPAEHFGRSRDIGSITPGRFADIIFLKDLRKFIVNKVMIDGKIVAADGKMTIRFPSYRYPKLAFTTINVDKKISPADLKIKAKSRSGTANVRVMKIIHYLITQEIIEKLPIKDNEVIANPIRDILKIIVLERYRASGRIGKAFISGFRLKKGALASSYCPDHHNIIAVGTSDEEISTAVNHLIDIKGGYVAAKGGKIVAKVEMPIAGIMSPEPIGIVADKLKKLNRAAVEEVGSELPSPFMYMMPLALACCPELRITERGLVRSSDLKVIPVITSEEK